MPITSDLSKALNNLNHNLLLTKLEAYRLDGNSVEFFRSYISNRYQLCKINNFQLMEKSFSTRFSRLCSWTITFQNFLLIFFYFFQSASLQITLMIVLCDKNVNNIMTSLNYDFFTLPNWFYKNLIDLILINSSLLFAVKDELQIDLVSNSVTINNKTKEKVLGTTITSNNERRFQA